MVEAGEGQQRGNRGARKGQGIGVRSHDVTTPTYEQLGIQKMEASRWQKLAKIEEEMNAPGCIKSGESAAGNIVFTFMLLVVIFLI